MKVLRGVRELLAPVLFVIAVTVGLAAPAAASPSPQTWAEQQLAAATQLSPQFIGSSDTDRLRAIMPDRTGDVYFDTPPDLSGVHGSLIDHKVISDAAGEAVGQQGLVEAIQYRFVTTNSADHKTFAVATYIYNISQIDEPPSSILVRNDAIDSLGTTCTTGYKLAHRKPVDMGWSLDQGFGELMVDHQGFNSAYGAAELGGHTVLDAMLALRQLPPEFIAPQLKFALQGYSGGAQVTLAANKLMASYAPSLVAQTAGAAMGGTPVDLESANTAMSGYFNAGGGLRSAVAIGLAREYPQMVKYFTPLGVALAHVVRNQCVDVFMYLGVLFSLVPEQAVMVPGAYESPEVQEVFRKTRFEGVSLSVKSVFYQGTDDPWLLYSSVLREYEAQRALGADVELLTVQGADHFTAAELARPQVQVTLKGWLGTN